MKAQCILDLPSDPFCIAGLGLLEAVDKFRKHRSTAETERLLVQLSFVRMTGAAATVAAKRDVRLRQRVIKGGTVKVLGIVPRCPLVESLGSALIQLFWPVRIVGIA